MSDNKLSHVDERNQPTMVDVGAKEVTSRSAVAQAVVYLPDAVVAAVTGDDAENKDIQSKKGPVFQTAIIAGTMAAKKTHELIPFCHPLGLERCRINIELTGAQAVITCEVAVHHKTGVEMEALTGANIAALTIYDMCKALSHDIVIGDVMLLSKTGGKSDYVAK